MSDVLIPEVIEEIPLEKVIDNTLVKNNVTDQVINALQEKYGGMKLVSVTDKESYLEIKEAKKEVRKVGIIVEKLCKKGREDAIAIQKKWLSKENEILDKINKVQLPLEAELKIFEDEEERVKQEEIKRKEEAAINRQAELTKLGAVYQNGCFVLNDVSFELDNIKNSDDDIYANSILPKYQIQFERNEAIRIQAEKEKQAAEEKLRLEREEFELKQKQFQEQQDAFKKQQEEADMKRREAELAQQQIAMAERQQLINKRAATLSELGMKFNGSDYLFEDVNVNTVEITTLDEQSWVALVQKITPLIAQRKEAIEQKRLADIEAQKELAAAAERKRIQEENEKNELLRKQEEQRQAEELAKASDKDKWAAYLSTINSIVLPVFTSNVYKGKLNIAKEKIEEINQL